MSDMVRTLNLNADIPTDRQLLISLPADIPAGPAEIVLVVSPTQSSQSRTLGEFAASKFFGMWSERRDIADTESYARQLRSEGWKRSA